METIKTRRLLLRPFTPSDAVHIPPLANDRDVSRLTALLPYPYTLKDAESWIESHKSSEAAGRGRPWAITRQDDGVFLGAIALDVIPADQVGQLGYWVGQKFWGKGYATEAATSVVSWGFAQGLVKVAADVFAINKASIMVLSRCGLRQEGLLRSHVVRDGQRLDLCCFGRLRDDQPPG